ncbi:hypothetical protein SELMODRAFT_410730 [Selaginella moellendorffii]|uniref:RRM domain-containing protein n=1 Tax=Selaginella moellendorffii TaxID=88036 RepID=D8RFP4_SELML|nr:nucleolin 1 [Selaginella moellendorffii]EFJ28903.1 hypothetical protein SELMODRAFT_410730 [Selaginella moellendorffii]|eukprot:XP_002969779.1 nucleolin 1 [Selaginella moellendorffii]
MASASVEAQALQPEEAPTAPPTSPPPPLVPPPLPDEQADDSRTFPLDVSSAGADLLRGTVQTKLSEFMGSYTDEVLAEYVVVLVGHGKQQKQATADLEAFLGVQSEAFVSWLWEHLTENLHVYTKAGEKKAANDALPKDTPEAKDKGENEKKENPTQENAKEENHVTKREPQALRQELKRSRSPEGWARRRRSRAEDKPSAIERLSPPPPAPPAPRLKASRRLLEFAVRDAVAPVGGSRRVADANTKRLRSIVSGSADHENAGAPLDSNGKLKARPAITKPAKNSPAMMIALKAAAAAAEDVNNRKVSKPVSRFAASIWDRLGHKSDEDDQPDQDLDDADEITEKMEYVHVDSAPRNSKSDRHMRKSRTADRLGLVERRTADTAMPPPPAASHDAYDHGEQFERRIEEVPESLNKKEPSKRHTLRKERRQKKVEEPLQYKRVFHTDDDTKHKDILPLERRTSVEQEKLVDIPNGKGQDLQDVTEMKRRMRQVELEVTKLRTKQDEAAKVSEKSSAPHPPAATTNIPSVPAATTSMQTAPLTSFKTPQSSSDDTDSKVILVTNVHFATTKEAISTHFGSCGEVVKVTMLTDGVSGKPKGSAYVEFSSKDAADRALSLNESSLLSRPIRVARKDANVAETSSPAAAVMRPRPPVRMPMRAAFPRAAFMRGSPYMMRPPPRLVRPPYPVGAPHLQWKRDGGASQMGPSSAAKNGFRSSVGPIRLKRSLSYVRPVVPVTPTPPEATAAPAAAAATTAAAGTAAALSTSTETQKGS